MKIAIVGYGKMGKEIEQQAISAGFIVSRVIDANDDIDNINFDSDEVAIEFTSPDACINNIKKLAEKGVSVVVGTTGWYDRMEEVKNIVKENNIGFLYGSNFSIGVHMFWQMLEQAAKIINKVPDYDVFCNDIHHKMKKDSPSGTAITTGKVLLNNIDRKTKLVTEELHRPVAEDEIHFSSTRGGYVFGHHKVSFDSLVDTIEISHNAKGREGFARGAVLSAEWLTDKKGFYTIEDYIKEALQND